MIAASELILNEDGSIYHLNLKPDEIADTIITVGDQVRVAEVSKYFDKIHLKKACREFHTHTGELDGKMLSVISTGIGTDNIDIVFNELDALVNIDFETKEIKKVKKELKFIRIGTSGCLQKDIPLDSFLFSKAAVGLDALAAYYQDFKQSESFDFNWQAFLGEHGLKLPFSYFVEADKTLHHHFLGDHHNGLTLTCPGFYGPQGRSLRLKSKLTGLLEIINQFSLEGIRPANFEMETAGIYLLSKLLGHKAVSCNVLLANRITGEFSKQPKQAVQRLIEHCLSKINNL